jgi:hypothetical protein
MGLGAMATCGDTCAKISPIDCAYILIIEDTGERPRRAIHIA